MGERQLTPQELAEFEASYELSKERLEEVYRNVLLWRVHGIEAYQMEANQQKDALIEELNDYLPLPMINIGAFSPPTQKGIRGRRPYSPMNSNMEGGLKKKRRSTKRRRHAYSR